jgi:hypothetical protein
VSRLRVIERSSCGKPSTRSWVVMICPALAIPAMREATLTQSPNTSWAFSITGP